MRRSQGLDRVRRAAERDKAARFTALLHHGDVDCLREAYWALNPKAAAGVDGVTWGAYDENLEANLQDLHRRLHSALGLASAEAERWVGATTSALTGLSSSLNSSGARARSRCQRT